MPDFSAGFTSGAPSLLIWRDPATASLPSRINPAASHPHRYRRGTVGVEIEVSARVDGVTGPLDAALGGRLFMAWLAEYPSQHAPPLSHPVGQSSVQRFTPTIAGHHTLVFRRAGGGGFILHVDVV
jgi:hypothetical protein